MELTAKTHELVQKMWNANRWGRIFRVFYWVLIIGVSVGAYYYFEPYLESLLGAYQGILSGVEKIQGTTQSLPDSETLNSLLEKFR